MNYGKVRVLVAWFAKTFLQLNWPEEFRKEPRSSPAKCEDNNFPKKIVTGQLTKTNWKNKFNLSKIVSGVEQHKRRHSAMVLFNLSTSPPLHRFCTYKHMTSIIYIYYSKEGLHNKLCTNVHCCDHLKYNWPKTKTYSSTLYKNPGNPPAFPWLSWTGTVQRTSNIIPLCNPWVFQLRHLTGPEHLPACLSNHCPVVNAESVAQSGHCCFDKTILFRNLAVRAHEMTFPKGTVLFFHVQ